jgi:hypothetical protein
MFYWSRLAAAEPLGLALQVAILAAAAAPEGLLVRAAEGLGHIILTVMAAVEPLCLAAVVEELLTVTV